MIALRFTGVALKRSEFELRLNAGVDRFEGEPNGSLCYAQVNPTFEGELWVESKAYIDKIGPKIERLLSEGAIVGAVIDFGTELPDSLFSKSIFIPALVSKTIGSHGIDVEVSTYRVSDE